MVPPSALVSDSSAPPPPVVPYHGLSTYKRQEEAVYGTNVTSSDEVGRQCVTSSEPRKATGADTRPQLGQKKFPSSGDRSAKSKKKNGSDSRKKPSDSKHGGDSRKKSNGSKHEDSSMLDATNNSPQQHQKRHVGTDDCVQVSTSNGKF